MSSDNQPNESSTWDDPRITAYLMGELPDEARTLFEKEIQASPELAAAVDEGRTVIGELEGFYNASSDATGGLDESRRAAIIDADEVQLPNSPGWSARRWMGLAVAASLVFVLAGLLLPSVQSAREASRTVSSRLDAEVRYDDAYAIDETLSEDGSGMSYSVPAPELASVPGSGPSDHESAGKPFAPVFRAEIAGRELSEIESTKESALGVAEYGEPPAVQIRQQEAAPTAPAADAMALRFGMQTEGYSRAKNKSLNLGDGVTGGYGGAMYGGGGAVGGGAMGGPSAMDDNSVDLMIDGVFVDVAEPRSLGRPGVALSKDPTNRFKSSDLSLFEDFGGDGSGNGPQASGDKYDPITDNPFKRVSEHPLSTFSIDVDTAAYSKIRKSLNSNRLPPPSAVRIEEMVNYFDYHYDGPGENSKHPFANNVALMDCPWNEDNLLARIAIKGKDIDRKSRPKCNLVFLLDTSGSMNQPSKLPLVVDGMKMLLKQLRPDDKVAIVTYAGSAGLVLDSTKASKKKKIRRALTQLSAGGSTNGGQGIQLAYDTARDHFIDGGVNRIILCSDGDFNVGRTSTGDLVSMVEKESKGGIFLTVLGFGMGNHNDAMMEQISGRGNGNYAYIDTIEEAHKVFVNQTAGTLITIAKDVKLQLEFNPNEVAAYRLIGYENRILAKEDFNDDKKDAGEIGAGHNVTALYEIVPAGADADTLAPSVDPLKYQADSEVSDAATSGELLTLKLRYKQPDGDVSTLIETPVKTDIKTTFANADPNSRFAAAVAGLGMQLRSSEHKGNWTPADVVSTAEAAIGKDEFGLRQEFVSMAKRVVKLMTGE